MAKEPVKATPDVPPDPAPASEPAMSLEEAGALLRQELNFHRAKLKLSGALETALAAKQQLVKLENEKTATMAAIDVANQKRLDIEGALSGKQAELDAVAGKITAAQADLKALNASILDTRKTWDSEQKMREEANRKEIATLDADITAKRRQLTQLRGQLAAVVAGYATEAP